MTYTSSLGQHCYRCFKIKLYQDLVQKIILDGCTVTIDSADPLITIEWPETIIWETQSVCLNCPCAEFAGLLAGRAYCYCMFYNEEDKLSK